MLEEVVGAVGLDPALESDKEAVPRAPGMKYRHYALRRRCICLWAGTPTAIWQGSRSC
jgi:hypothetical protein